MTATFDVVPYRHPALAAPPDRELGLNPRRTVWTRRQLLDLTARYTELAGRTLRALARHDPAERWYTRLALTEGVEVWLLGWTPGQGTAPHDHGGASGAFTVLDGVLAEDYRERPGEIRRATVTAGAGRAFGADRVHVVSNPGRTTATSVHAYSPPGLPLTEYPDLEPGR